VNLYAIRLLYLRELRSALRERSIVIGSLLVPLLLYPVLLWLAFTAITFLQGQEERFVSRVAVTGLPPEHRQLADEIAALESMAMLPAPDAGSIEAAVAGGAVDAVAEILPAAAEDAGLADNFRVRLIYDSSEDRSVKARRRLVAAVDAYRERWIREQAAGLGVDDRAFDGIRVERLDLATSGERGAFLLGMLVPLLMIIMIAVGCFYPAVDSIAGERERSTWETSLSLATSRTAMLVAKYLYVATLGGVAGLLNLAAMTLTMSAVLAPLLGEDGAGLEFRIPFAGLPLLAAAAVLLALFIAAGMMVFAAFARNFKEGQSMVSPFYMVCILPALFVQSPDMTLGPGTALVPIVNVALLFRDAISGVFHWPAIALTFAVEAATIAVCLAAARFVLGFEDVMTGTHSGGLGKFLGRVWRRSPRAVPGETPS
jgi:ABC-type Na+ efflux pump permease subunit